MVVGLLVVMVVMSLLIWVFSVLVVMILWIRFSLCVCVVGKCFVVMK